MFLNFTSQRFENGNKLVYIGEIAEFYLKNGFFVDIISLLAFPFDIVILKNKIIFLLFIYIFKLFSSIQKFERF
jgi:hypothetical protein